MTDDAAIAITGMACRLPGANTPERFWHNLCHGVEGISRFTVGQLVAAGLDPDLVRRPDYVPARGVIERGECFDHELFGYSPAEAAGFDPQHRVFLETSAAALDAAAIDPHRFPGWIGVFAGSSTVNPDLPAADSDEVTRLLGYEKDFLATKVAYKLGLRGPALTVQTACSTALVAIHYAAQSLLSYECDAAVAGGASLWMPQVVGHLYQPGSINSVDGHCRAFDADATGTVGGNGVAAVVVRRLADALAEGDPIVAVLRGSAVNNDGAEKVGYIAPSVTGQRAVIRLALARAGVDPGDVGYVEAHGTGTRVGDPIEVAALTQAFREGTERVGYCRLGSVKGNIGHTGPAAGAAGVIKAALMLRHREFVPTLHYRRPNPELELESSPFVVADRHEPWRGDGPLLAGVSSFGMGGTNVHAVLESAPDRTRPVSPRRPRVFCLSAHAPAALRRMRDELADHVESTVDSVDTADVARTLADGRRRFAFRGAVVAADPAGLAAALRTAKPAVTAAADVGVAFLFPGQGALRSGFGRSAHELLPVFRATFDELATAARERFGVELGAALDPATDPAWLRDTVHQQLGLFAIGYAFARQFMAFGVTPSTMLGHSIGEYVAATVAGLWSPLDALSVIHERGRAMRDTPAGGMAVVAVPAGKVRELLVSRPDLTLAVAGSHHSVLAGPAGAIEALRADGLTERLLDTDRAFHSPLVRPAAEALGTVVAATPSARPALPFLSNLTGGPADANRVTQASYWVDHLVSTVQLAANTDTLLAGGSQVFVELGPGRSMTRSLTGHPHWRPEFRAITVDGTKDEGEEHALLTALAGLWEHGFDIDIDVPAGEPSGQRCTLPTYPFEPTDCSTAVRPRLVEKVSGTGRPEGPLPERLADIWCSVLGVPGVSDEDDFYRLGGESITSITLLGRIRDQLDIAVPLTSFSERPVFGRLVELARQARPETPANLLTLRATGERPPLFLAAPAAGSSLVYRRLVELLDPDQPCYGLESPGLHDGATPLRRFEDIAAHHVELIRRVRPEGPYLLGGWSVGAMVAHEMTRQLIEAGETVTGLVAIDACVFGTAGRALGRQPGFLVRTLGSMVGNRLHGPPGVGDLARDAPGVDFARVFNANLAAMLRYRPRPVPCDIVVFKTVRRAGEAEALRARVAPLYRGTTTVVASPGDHWSILGEHVGWLAGRINGMLGSPLSLPLAG
ncbi:beta-ketoacyl synthase N-terminal-like domain-containing protein [Amycolatopsis sp., V23-08]|uniref:Beta-ketoacyl synthase N-terminal-like domain-containing protein n=1 Tax=Amycolatopsis heterodermiae TaxID=3110235 RepID=A0ABU5R253_9PSEU|nr:beta-ketoacyl synthase N-terminal-like domain-containing protein [Amycolatopsis sp., V23-08]MEA5360282.1 beta-ketoacyl synthase N-terminal-like domain-containing protein [Amycolatopsis sp., V23-08]